MIYVPIKHLKPGMMIAKDITYGYSIFSLINTGQILTHWYIGKLYANNITGAYIETKSSEDLMVEPLMSPELKQTLITEIKSTYMSYQKKQMFSDEMMRSVSTISATLISHILQKEEWLFNIMEIKDYDSYTMTHSMAVGLLAVLIGVKLGFSNARLVELGVCGFLHDIGKLDIPVEIVNKPGRLTPEEFALMQKHPQMATERLKHCMQVSRRVIEGIAGHHEKIDGTGYPKGIKGKDIPIYCKILAICDVYDALTSKRTYRDACPSSEALEYIISCADTHFDIELVQVFLKIVVAYPTGSIVRLSNGYFAVVTANSPQNIFRPKVQILHPPEYKNLIINLAQDTSYLNVTIEEGATDNMELPEGVLV